MKRRLNVLMVTSQFPNSQEPTKGIFSYHIAKGLKAYCDIKIIAPIPWVPQSIFTNILPERYQIDIPFQEKIDGIEVYHPRYVVIPKISGFMHGFSMYFPLRNLINQLHQQRGFDVINARWMFPDGLATTLVANKMGIPVIVSALGCDINLYINYKLRKPQLLYTLKKAGLISTVSMALRDRIIELGISPDKIQCIYNGVDASVFFPKEKIGCRKKLNLDEEEKIILFIGGMDPVKGVEYLVQAFAILNGKRQDKCRLILIGDGNLRKDLENQVEQLSLNQKVTFAGKRPHDEIPDWINASDLLCLPSIREGRPNVVIESLACGKPVVASRVGGVPELVNSINGILTEPRDPEGLAGAIDKVLNKKWSSEEISGNIKHFSWRSCAEQFILAYETLLNSDFEIRHQ